MIVGTAGHIDHGKTTLVRALTGVDTDRLPEEKRRGITIDLGFAPLVLDGVGTVGVVDVPGHEAFVRTMVAGATGIDLALLVVAADEGVMPQTREHLAILELLGVRGGVVALTKADLVDDEWLALVSDDVRSVLSGGALADAPLVPVSSTTGLGIGGLREAMAEAARALSARAADDLFRMPVDRAFSVRGTGTVATGTVWSGSLGRDASLRLFPSGELVRVRGLQAHGASVDRIHAGARAAIALAGVDLDRVGRGAVLVGGDGWHPSSVLRADVALLDDAPRPLGARTRVRLHLGTSEVGARIVAAGGTLEPGQRRPARIVLDEPIVARAGDRFVLRSPSPAATIGGGIVVDPLAPPRARAAHALGASPRDNLLRLLAEVGVAGVSASELPVRVGRTPAETVGLANDDAIWRVAGRLFAASVRDALASSILATVARYHSDHPLELGAPQQWLRSRLGAPDSAVDAVLSMLTARGQLVVEQGNARAPGFAPTLTSRQRDVADALVERLRLAGNEPPSIEELAVELGVEAGELGTLARQLARDGSLVAVEPNRYFLMGSVDQLVGSLMCGMSQSVDYGPADLRPLIGLTRKFLIPFLEYCDREGYTIRDGLGRRRIGTRLAKG
jgi:selenocysteine-specific elongation factor